MRILSQGNGHGCGATKNISRTPSPLYSRALSGFGAAAMVKRFRSPARLRQVL
jgi:hypothetical protein